MSFTDHVSLIVQSGHGGPGCTSFSREAFRPRGGPDGGDGGNGGDVFFQVDKRLHSLYHIRGTRKLSAKNGLPGSSAKCAGARGQCLEILVPPGTVVKNQEGQTLLDLVEGRSLFLEGGRGGLGNFHFKNSRNQAPQHSQSGLPGAEKSIALEVRLIADVGLVGLPNAGKSTLLSVLTSARPKIGSYPFTTLQPQLGVVEVDKDFTFTMADIPGLIEGAAEGAGLGHQFLQHIKRNRILLHLVALGGFEDPWDSYLKINKELLSYDEKYNDLDMQIADKPQIVVLSKMDSVDSETLEDVQAQFSAKGVKTLPISSVSHSNLKEVIRKIQSFLKEERG